MIKYRDLKDNDYVWVIYDANWDKSIPSQYKYAPSDYTVEKCLIVKNNLNVPRTIDHSTPWEEPHPFTVYEHWISIRFKDMIYSRYYTDNYDEYKHMIITPEVNVNGPTIEVFSNYEYAKEYLINMCQKEINNLRNIINEKQEEINLLEKSLKQVE